MKQERQNKDEKRRKKLLFFWLFFSAILSVVTIGLILGLSLKDNRNYINLNITTQGQGRIEGLQEHYLDGQEITLKAIPDEGYYFGGWLRNNALIQKDAQITFYASEGYELVALFLINTEFGVYLHLNDSSNVIIYWGSVVSGWEATNILLIGIEAPSRIYHSFVNWHFGPSGTHDPYCTDEEHVFNDEFGPITEELHLYAVWVANVHDVYVDLNGDGDYDDLNETLLNHLDKDSITLGVPTKNGYTFAGWILDDGTITNLGFITSYILDSDGYIYPSWSVNSYDLIFDSNGGSSVATITQAYNSLVSKPTDPSRNGYTFAGWYDAETANNGSGTLITWPYTLGYTNTTLYANWSINSYDLIFDSNGGSSVATITQAYNSLVSKPTDPTKNGYSFAGWYDGETANNGSGTLITWPYTLGYTNTTLYANWEAKQTTLSFDDGVSEVISVPQDLIATFGTLVPQILDLPVVVLTGYNFLGWYDGAGSEANQYYDATGSALLLWDKDISNFTLIAHWQAKTSVVSFDDNFGDVVLSVPTSVLATYGQNMPTISVTPSRSGYVFSGFYDDPTTGNIYYNADLSSAQLWDKDTNSPSVLYAHYTPWQLSITFYSNYVTQTTATQTILFTDSSKNLNPNNFSRIGYTFAGWATSSGGSIVYADEANVASSINAPTATLNLWAKWTVVAYSISYENLFGVANTSPTSYNIEETITLTTISGRTGYDFTGWQVKTSSGSWVAGTTYDLTNLEISSGSWGNVTFVAQWEGIEVVVNFNYLYSQPVGDAVTATAIFGNTYSGVLPTPTARSGYGFAGWWTKDGTLDDWGVKIEVTTQVSVATTHTLYAKWSGNSVTVTYIFNDGLTESSNHGAIAVGTPYGTLLLPSRTGYTFAGWYLDNTTFTNEVTPTTEVVSVENHNIYAKWELVIYTIYYNGNGGTPAIASSTYDIENEVILTSASKDGYDFTGWQVISDIGSWVQLTTYTSPVGAGAWGNVTLVAQWVATSYTITYNGNGGTPSVSSLTYDIEDSVALASATKDGYTLSGWVASSNVGSWLTSSTYNGTLAAGAWGNVTLVAQWEAIVYDIIYHNIEVTDANPNPSTYTILTPTITYANPTRSGYRFDGWYSDSSFTTAVSTIASGSFGEVEVYGKWSLLLNFVVETNGVDLVSTPNNYAIGDEVDFVLDLSDIPSGLRLTWRLDGTIIAGTTDELSYQLTLDASYEGKTLSISFEVSVIVIYPEVTHLEEVIHWITYGGDLTLSALDGDIIDNLVAYNFVRFAADIDNDNAYLGSTNIIASFNVYAIYQQATVHNITFHIGDLTVTIGAIAGEDFVVPGWIGAPDGYTISSWNTQADGLGTSYAPQATINVSTNIHLYAILVSSQYLEVEFEYDDASSGNDLSSFTYEVGEEYGSLPSPLKDGYLFAGWYSENTYENLITSTSIVSAGVLILYAKWEVNTVTIYFDALEIPSWGGVQNLLSLVTYFITSGTGNVSIYDDEFPSAIYSTTIDLGLVAGFTINFKDNSTTKYSNYIDASLLAAGSSYIFYLNGTWSGDQFGLDYHLAASNESELNNLLAQSVSPIYLVSDFSVSSLNINYALTINGLNHTITSTTVATISGDATIIDLTIVHAPAGKKLAHSNANTLAILSGNVVLNHVTIGGSLYVYSEVNLTLVNYNFSSITYEVGAIIHEYEIDLFISDVADIPTLTRANLDDVLETLEILDLIFADLATWKQEYLASLMLRYFSLNQAKEAAMVWDSLLADFVLASIQLDDEETLLMILAEWELLTVDAQNFASEYDYLVELLEKIEQLKDGEPQEQTSNITFNVENTNGAAALTASGLLAIIVDSNNIVTAVSSTLVQIRNFGTTDAAEWYDAFNTNRNNVIKIGSSTNTGSFTLQLDSLITITSLKITACTYANDKGDLKVGSTTYALADSVTAWETISINLTDISSNAITIASSVKRILIKSIEVKYLQITDAQKLALAQSALSIDQDILEAQNSISLPALGLYATAIAWSKISGDNLINLITGAVSHHAEGTDANKTIVLRATISIGGLSTTKDFEVVIHPKTINVTFDLNGGNLSGSVINPLQSGVGGLNIENPGNPIKAGFVFIGWVIPSTEPNYQAWGSLITESLVLQAKWEAEVRVTFTFAYPEWANIGGGELERYKDGIYIDKISSYSGEEQVFELHQFNGLKIVFWEVAALKSSLIYSFVETEAAYDVETFVVTSNTTYAFEIGQWDADVFELVSNIATEPVYQSLEIVILRTSFPTISGAYSTFNITINGASVAGELNSLIQGVDDSRYPFFLTNTGRTPVSITAPTGYYIVSISVEASSNAVTARTLTIDGVTKNYAFNQLTANNNASKNNANIVTFTNNWDFTYGNLSTATLNPSGGIAFKNITVLVKKLVS
ncbi:MAG: InlB B-repeat-containing protein [Acholeplasmatales bacterium]|nr:InlB B-repeat-containing protein [Acholeplasmatales bacterium]